MTESIGWLAMSLFCAAIGAVLGAALVHRRLDDPQVDRDS